ncbi:MAG: polysaccharide deacetylase family protein [Tannerellaceae bacterium]|jgi:peptidoglycan/xylan/chitin deacetylase (PgdA/CDA1 family)|nr:polysaccharide deacetylase family protein [Tannerellaceae bacterium]
MLIEQPPRLYRALFRGAIWRKPANEKCVYLTFDDGPIPNITPWVLDTLAGFGIQATFFCVGDNVARHPHLYDAILSAGHSVGNHTFNHLQGLRTRTSDYIANVEKAARHIRSSLFRPPHGHLRLRQTAALRKQYSIIMWDVVTRDYSPHVSPADVFRNVRRYTRNGSIIVFHDSLKAERNMKAALPHSIEWLLGQGYCFRALDAGAGSRPAPGLCP